MCTPFTRHTPILTECPLTTCCDYKVAYSCKKIDCCPEQVSTDPMDIELSALSVDFNQDEGVPLATFFIGDGPGIIRGTWTAMTLDDPMVTTTGDIFTTVINNEFTIAIPLNTTDLQITINLPQVNITLTSPANSVMFRLSEEELNLYMAFKYANQVAIDTSGLDHETPVAPVVQHQLGPHRSSRAMAIVHIAMFDALLAISGYNNYTPYSYVSAPIDASPEAALYQAVHDALIGLYPSHQPRLDLILSGMLATIPDGSLKDNGIAIGAAAAASILADRTGDGTPVGEQIYGVDFPTTTTFGEWRPAPNAASQVALGRLWGTSVTPFFLVSNTEVSFPPFNDFTSREYAMDFNNIKSVGGDGTVTPTVRSQEQTYLGYYFAYDGVPTLCAPPRLYNQIAFPILADHLNTVIEIARGIALLHVGMADAGISSWYYKYFYNIWRPVTAMREPTTNTVNSETIHDPNWLPLGAPASNTMGDNFTPPFPAYPSGHATFGGVTFQLLRNLLGTDVVPFTFLSDELNGETIDNITDLPRAEIPRAFTTLSQAEEENAYSRIPLGIHFNQDKNGTDLGNSIADLLVARVYTAV